MELPEITIVIVTLNNQRTLPFCLKSIKEQNYPKEKIEYLNIDGGSTDASIRLMKDFGFKIINSTIKRNAEAQRAIGLKMAKNDLVVSLDADNYLPNSNWLLQMVQPFVDDPQIVHAGTLHFSYRKNDCVSNRYCSLLGVNDPVVYYIGRPDRLPQNIIKWTKGKIIKETTNYYIVEFNKDTLPTVGCNGVVYRKNVLLKYAKSSPTEFLHIDVFADLINNGYNRFAVVKNDVIHDTAINLRSLVKKRLAFLSGYYLRNGIKRRYLIYNPKNPKDNIKLLLFIIYTITFIKPFLDSLKGYLYIRDSAWFLHPIICLIYLYTYAQASLKNAFQKIKT